MARALAEVCVPRPSVFDPSVRDTVYDIGRLNDLDPDHFFNENYVTVRPHPADRLGVVQRGPR